MTTGCAPGKVILFGEHAVVYGYPAIAVPVSQVQARACVEEGSAGHGAIVVAPDIGRRVAVREAPQDDPLACAVRVALDAMHQAPDPDLVVTVTSTIPVARGMGSGAAVSTAIVRALSAHLHCWLTSQALSDLVYQTEVLYHGTPSGIDNTVIAFEKPVYFVRGVTREVFWVGRPFLLAVADTGIESPTRAVVGDLRRRYEAEPAQYRPLFEQAGAIATEARAAVAQGKLDELGRLMTRNQALLQQMGVSCPELDRLVEAARQAGALGAKLSGAGRGGNMIALVTEESCNWVETMLRLAGAAHVLVTKVR